MTNEMLLIPRGEFLMGLSKEQSEDLIMQLTPPDPPISPYLFYSEVPAHKVKLNDFSISKCEVTNREFKNFVEEGGYERKEFWRELIEMPELNTDFAGWDRIQLFVDATGKPGPGSWLNGTFPEGKAEHPVDGVSWFEATAYCRWKKVRLPREAEWEYAARGTDGRIFPWGDDPLVFQKWGQMQGGETTSCGEIGADKSPFGLTDQARNVAEWVADTWHFYANAPVDPQPLDEAYGILRGGNYTSQILTMRTTYRVRTPKLERRGGIGFRCAS